MGQRTVRRPGQQLAGLRERLRGNPAARQPQRMPPAQDGGGFIETLEQTGDVELAAMAVIRSLTARNRVGRLRTVSQALQRHPGTSRVGDIGRALIALHEGEAERAWGLFCSQDPERVVCLAPLEFFRAGFRCAPDHAAALLERARSGELTCALGAREWQRIAEMTFAAGHEDLSQWATQRVLDLTNGSGPLAEDAAWLRRWYGRRHAVSPSPRPAGVAILDDDHPRRLSSKAPRDLPGQRRVLEAVAKHPQIQLFRAGRDATSFAEVGDGTWLIVTGRLPQPLFGIRSDLPYDDRYRPVFAAVRVPDLSALTPPVLHQLRRCSPVGCGDWDTYYLMRAAGVPAFLADDAPEILTTLLEALASGVNESVVRELWENTSRDAVAAGFARDAAVSDLPPIEVDINAACRAVRAKATVIERRERGPEGDEINVEFSLDGNLKHHMVVVLDAIVRRASRPIRLFVLCRDHTNDDYQRLAELFPTVSFVWLPTDDVDYGSRLGMFRHITIATMDRLLLPELLPDVDRVIHHDLDAICLTDLAELDSVDLGHRPLAAATSPRPRYRDGLGECRSTARRLRKSGQPGLARELIARSHLRHQLGYEVFNAGVMVLNLQRMREDGFFREFFPYAERFGMNDQAVLNAYAGAERVILDPSWNWCPRIEDLADPRIAHWSGPMKPWQARWVNGQELWRDAEALAATRERTPRATVQAM